MNKIFENNKNYIIAFAAVLAIIIIGVVIKRKIQLLFTDLLTNAKINDKIDAELETRSRKVFDNVYATLATKLNEHHASLSKELESSAKGLAQRIEEDCIQEMRLQRLQEKRRQEEQSEQQLQEQRLQEERRQEEQQLQEQRLQEQQLQEERRLQEQQLEERRKELLLETNLSFLEEVN